jgi:hypothetical protein
MTTQASKAGRTRQNRKSDPDPRFPHTPGRSIQYPVHQLLLVSNPPMRAKKFVLRNQTRGGERECRGCRPKDHCSNAQRERKTAVPSSYHITRRLAASTSRSRLYALTLADLYRRLVIGCCSTHPFLNLSGHG